MVGRDSRGRFAEGNQAAKGNNGGRPRRSTEEKYLKAMSRCVTLKDWEKIIDVAVARAKAGDTQSRQWLSDYLIGKPLQRQEITGKDGGPIRTKDETPKRALDPSFFAEVLSELNELGHRDCEPAPIEDMAEQVHTA